MSGIVHGDAVFFFLQAFLRAAHKYLGWCDRGLTKYVEEDISHVSHVVLFQIRDCLLLQIVVIAVQRIYKKDFVIAIEVQNDRLLVCHASDSFNRFC